MMSKPGRSAGWFLLGAAVVYVWGAFHVLGVLDIEEVCGARDQVWEYDPGRRDSLLPLSSPCNASYDLVPPYVNPLFFALLTLSATFTVIAVVRRVRASRTGSFGSVQGC